MKYTFTYVKDMRRDVQSDLQSLKSQKNSRIFLIREIFYEKKRGRSTLSPSTSFYRRQFSLYNSIFTFNNLILL